MNTVRLSTAVDAFGAGAPLGSVQVLQALVTAANENRQLTVMELGRRIHADPPQVSRFVRGMVDAGFLRYCHDQRDNRIKRVQLTESGRKVAERLFGRQDCSPVFEPAVA